MADIVCAGVINAVSSMTGVGHAIRETEFELVVVDAISMSGSISATASPTATVFVVRGLAGSIQATSFVLGRNSIWLHGTISATSTLIGAVGGSTILTKELYVKSGSDWTKILPVGSVVNDLDDGTF